MNIPNLIGIWLAWVCNVREVWVWCSEKLAFQELWCAWLDRIRQQMEDDLNGRFKRGLGGYMLQSVSSTRGWERLSQLVASQSLWSGFPRFLPPTIFTCIPVDTQLQELCLEPVLCFRPLWSLHTSHKHTIKVGSEGAESASRQSDRGQKPACV